MRLQYRRRRPLCPRPLRWDTVGVPVGPRGDAATTEIWIRMGQNPRRQSRPIRPIPSNPVQSCSYCSNWIRRDEPCRAADIGNSFERDETGLDGSDWMNSDKTISWSKTLG